MSVPGIIGHLQDTCLTYRLSQLSKITSIPVASDPSHAVSWRNWVPPMSLASIASGADSIMLEVHPDPDNAAVDPFNP